MESEAASGGSFPDSMWLERLLECANSDAELLQKAGDLRGQILFQIGGTRHLIRLNERHLTLLGVPQADDSWDLLLEGPLETWAQLFSPFPSPGHQSFTAVRVTNSDFRYEGDQLLGAQILPVLERLKELAGLTNGEASGPALPRPDHGGKPRVERNPGQIIGGYVDLPDPNGRPWRVYFEEAGKGLPLVLLHTAGADSRQFHELLCDVEIAGRWHMLAFDLPFHGRSTPAGTWWRTPYSLDTETYAHWCVTFIKKVVGARAVVMGCSMGGAMAVYLAARHRSEVCASIGLEAPDRSPGRLNRFLSNPGVNQACYAPTYVYGLMSPLSPEEHRRRAWWYYSQGGYGVYAGDLNFYSREWDATDPAREVDIADCPIYLLTGEYDFSATPESSSRLASLIPGAGLRIMKGLGHFPMTENPDEFRGYLIPVLEELEERLEKAQR